MLVLMATNGIMAVPGWTIPAIARVTGPTAAQAGPSAMIWVRRPVMMLPDRSSPSPAPKPSGTITSMTELAIQ